ncbi:hypothetical protein BZA05DRAFT_434120 [Tricharina praecox]|uniref:uncharacterized protein n=1 Tax=Tricharina praecox TaxID=43433 RepID=UPI00221F4F98|nr:uncharacterized protein BZA05DRAFT_434120 [Tricharina praecox]KAI5856613.1 hypothetical protein BZA05DRAFT_434120 [Tricharina praecox]
MHEKLCVLRFLRDDLGNDWPSVGRMYNEHWYPDHPKGVYKGALYSRYKKEVPKGDGGNTAILGVDDDWVWVSERYRAVPQADPPKDKPVLMFPAATEEQNNEATCVVENGITINQGDAMDTSEDEDEDEEPPAPRRPGALTIITGASFAVMISNSDTDDREMPSIHTFVLPRQNNLM